MNTWTDFWNKQTSFSDEYWKKHIEHFLTASRPIIGYAQDDVLLDIGCGAGYLEFALKDTVAELYGVDTSSRYVKECQQRFRDVPNAHFHQLPEYDFLDFGSIPAAGRVSLVICLSVIQYYRSMEDVKRLIAEARKLVRPKARMLIADIPLEGGVLRDLAGSIGGGIRNGMLLEKLRLFLKAGMSDYYAFRKRQGLLRFHRFELLRMTDQLGLAARFLDEALTLNTRRGHLLIQFP